MKKVIVIVGLLCSMVFGSSNQGQESLVTTTCANEVSKIVSVNVQSGLPLVEEQVLHECTICVDKSILQFSNEEKKKRLSKECVGHVYYILEAIKKQK